MYKDQNGQLFLHAHSELLHYFMHFHQHVAVSCQNPDLEVLGPVPTDGNPMSVTAQPRPAPGLWAHDFSPSEKSYQYLVGSDWGPWVCPVWRKGGWGADLSAWEAAHWSKLPRQVASNPYLSVLRKPVPLTTLIFGQSWSLVGQDGHFSPNWKYLKCLSLCIKRHYGF